ncbi:hypothetical protein ACQKL5_13525 [Peribacillus sp. NPDC097675]|uniref:hypothetical protein n=1 Tax=Peribacillus sp. NPDC097675 TaxID=3390618 RepID=UPI003D0851A5
MQKKADRKLFHLFTGELTATILFAAMWLLYIQQQIWIAHFTSFPPIYAFVLLEFILLQGSLYWFLKWKRAKQKKYGPLPPSHLRMFLLFKKINFVLILIGALVSVYQIIKFPDGHYWFAFLYAFAIIEHINYYHIRLSYQTPDEIKEFLRQKKFRSSILAKELAMLKVKVD